MVTKTLEPDVEVQAKIVQKQMLPPMDLSVASCTAEELFSGTIVLSDDQGFISGSLSIPEYQRPYVWKEKQLNRLLKDLIDYKQEEKRGKPLYYLGSIILHRQDNQLKIIDGQQRITTLLLLQTITNRGTLPEITYQSPVSVANIRHNFSYLKAVFDGLIPTFSGTRESDIPDFSEINVTLIITNSEDLAYTFFETQNTGGVRLSGSAIAKAHHLRVIESKKVIAYQARRWEQKDSDKLDLWINNLIKIRFWKNRYWQIFPFYRNELKIKETVIEEFTERTIHHPGDVSYYYSEVQTREGRQYQLQQSPLRQVRQPLYDGNNFLDYIDEYISLHQILFEGKTDHRVSNAFYKFRDVLLHGNDGTLFLKELTEIALVTYVSRFGFQQLYEFALWIYRYIYSMRVSFDRNVREDSIFKFAYDNALIDTILDAYTIDELIGQLKCFSYSFNEKYLDSQMAKNRHVQRVKKYFENVPGEGFTTAAEMQQTNRFDRILIHAITQSLQNLSEHE